MNLRRTLIPLVLLAIASTGAIPNASARTWTDVEGRVLEGDLVKVDGKMVEIKRATSGKILKVAIARLSKADQAFLKSQAKPEADGGPADASPFRQLKPQVTLKVTPITGKGEDRKAEIVADNTSGRSITQLGVRMLFLKKDGSVDKSVPHTHAGDVAKGGSHTIEVSSFFMEEDTASIAGVVESLIFKDGSTWPATPTPPPARNGEDPVAATMIGVVGSGDQAQPVVACFNHDAKAVTSVNYRIEYLDADGEVLDTTGYGYGSDTPIMENGKGTVISGGKAPPNGAVGAQVKVRSVTFSDETRWSPEK